MPINIGGKNIYRIKEASEQIGRSRETLRKWIRENKIADVHLNKRKEREWTDEDIRRFRDFANVMAEKRATNSKKITK